MDIEGHSQSRFSPGSLVAGRFTIVRHLATGSMGSVFLALDRKLGDTEVALKLLHSKFLTDPIGFKRFSNEVVFARKLAHPNIVRIYDFEEASTGEKLISMEYVQGTTLGDFIREMHGDVSVVDPPTSSLYQVDFKRALKIYKKLLAGVDCAHKAGILHRDLKPCNVLLDTADEPKIADFGLATVAGTSSGLTSDGKSLIGTPDYMAPEQVLGQRMTARSDIYSLGVIAFELLVGRTPFIAEGPLAVAYMQVQAPFPSLERLPDFIPQTFIHLIKKATQKTPHERFSSVEEMIELISRDTLPGEIRLQQAHSGRYKKPTGFGNAKPQGSFGSPQPKTKFSSDHPIIFGFLAVLLVLSIGSTTFFATNVVMELKGQSEQIEVTKPEVLMPDVKKKKIPKVTRKKTSSQ